MYVILTEKYSFIVWCVEIACIYPEGIGMGKVAHKESIWSNHLEKSKHNLGWKWIALHKNHEIWKDCSVQNCMHNVHNV